MSSLPSPRATAALHENIYRIYGFVFFSEKLKALLSLQLLKNNYTLYIVIIFSPPQTLSRSFLPTQLHVHSYP